MKCIEADWKGWDGKNNLTVWEDRLSDGSLAYSVMVGSYFLEAPTLYAALDMYLSIWRSINSADLLAKGNAPEVITEAAK